MQVANSTQLCSKNIWNIESQKWASGLRYINAIRD